jgi:hypothetical protein
MRMFGVCRNSYWRFAAAALSVALVLSCAELRGDLIIEVQDASVTPGGQSFVDVTVRSRSGTLNLNDFSISVGITGFITNGELLFSAGQMSDTDMSGLSDYVFSTSRLSSGDTSFYSTTVINSPPPTIVAADALVGLSPQGVSVGTTSLLLARLNVTHSFFSTAADSLGDTYTLAVDNPSGDTYFLDKDGNSVAFTIGRAGLLTVTPEPSVAILGGVAACVTAFWLRRRRAQLHRLA